MNILYCCDDSFGDDGVSGGSDSDFGERVTFRNSDNKGKTALGSATQCKVKIRSTPSVDVC